MGKSWILPTGSIVIVLATMLAGIILHAEPGRPASATAQATTQAELVQVADAR